MGRYRFLVHPADRLPASDLARAFLAGSDYVPWLCRARATDDGFIIERDVSDSGCLHLPWRVEGYGQLMLTTATLVERDAPYHLEVELARGKLNQLRNQLADWSAMGMDVPEETIASARQAANLFAQAATSKHLPLEAAAKANQAIRCAIDACHSLCASFAEQAFTVRHRQAAKLPTLLGVNLGAYVPEGAASDALAKATNAAIVPFSWREIETHEGTPHWDTCASQIAWCQTHSKRVCGGPLLAFDRRGMPDWVCLWEGDFDNLLELTTDYVRRVVERYRGQVHVWQCAARMYSTEVLSLSEEDRLRLVVRVIETVRQADPGTPTLVSFDQPWADYLRDTPLDLSPLHVGDALVRSGLGLSGLVLEINVGCEPGGSVPRDPLEFSRLIDRWSGLGLPLVIELTLPSGDAADLQARAGMQPTAGALAEGWSPAAQRSWCERILPLVVSKPAVHAVFWNQSTDAPPHDYPHAGLIDSTGRPKPALATLAQLRQAHLH